MPLMVATLRALARHLALDLLDVRRRDPGERDRADSRVDVRLHDLGVFLIGERLL